MTNNNPCNQCLVNPMCKVGCPEFAEYIKKEAPDWNMNKILYEDIARELKEGGHNVCYNSKKQRWIWTMMKQY